VGAVKKIVVGEVGGATLLASAKTPADRVASLIPFVACGSF
jgi:hypothetical protein